MLKHILIKKRITSDSQGIYQGNNFYRNISDLIRWGLVRTKKKFQNENFYILTLKGELQALNLYSYSLDEKDFEKIRDQCSSNAKLLYHTASENLGRFLTDTMGWSEDDDKTKVLSTGKLEK